MQRRIIIMGAAGRDFHNFNVVYRDDPLTEVVAFTATQIPFIDDRPYPTELAGPRYPDGIPIYPEEDLAHCLSRTKIDDVVFAYSDVSYEYVMHKASEVHCGGRGFQLLGPIRPRCSTPVPVVAVCAVRTGAARARRRGTSPSCSRRRDSGRSRCVIRCPTATWLPSACSGSHARGPRSGRCHGRGAGGVRSAHPEGTIVYAGVDYGAILERAQGNATCCSGTAATTTCPSTDPTSTSRSPIHCVRATSAPITQVRPTFGWPTRS